MKTVYFIECETPPPFGYMLNDARGYVSKDGVTTVLYGPHPNSLPSRGWPDGGNILRKKVTELRRAPARTVRAVVQPATRITPAPPRKKRQQRALRVGICAICSAISGLTRHHLIPQSLPQTGSNHSRKTERICWSCHRSIHHIFTNDELAAIPWNTVVAAIQNKIHAPVPDIELGLLPTPPCAFVLLQKRSLS